jgi:hypothetical protein
MLTEMLQRFKGRSFNIDVDSFTLDEDKKENEET